MGKAFELGFELGLELGFEIGFELGFGLKKETPRQKEETPIYYNSTLSTRKDIEEAYQEYLRNKDY